MNYEKEYEATLERAREIHKDAIDMGDSLRAKMAEFFFPELKESEEEKNIKNLIDELKCSLRAAKCQDDACRGGHEKRIALLEWGIAWLEKQGEKLYSKSALEAVKEEPIDNTNKVEPKFKVGQWVVWQDKYYKVNYNGCGYELVDQNGLSTSLEYGTLDENAHIWDIIKCAKDGDVLVICSNKPFIFKGFFKPNFPNCLVAYCGIALDDHFRLCNNKSFWTNLDVKPATKEQRELLFAKMEEAGYKWDAKSKQLIKL